VIARYQKRISGPILDQIDIHIEVLRADYEKLSDDHLGEPSANVQARVDVARERQRERFANVQMANQQIAKSTNGIACNADMRPAQIRQYCQLDETCSSLMRTAMNQMQLSERAYHRVLTLGRTIADLVGEEKIAPTHLAEALKYRPPLGMCGFKNRYIGNVSHKMAFVRLLRWNLEPSKNVGNMIRLHNQNLDSLSS
jgi:magnesium chelatase family protein